MKKTTIMIVTVLAIILSVVCLTACVGKVEGTYKFYSITIEGLTMQVGDSYLGMFRLSEDFMVYEFRNDGTCSVKVPFQEEAQIGTWTQNGKEISIVFGDESEEPIIATLNGEELVIEGDEGQKLVLKKSK